MSINPVGRTRPCAGTAFAALRRHHRADVALGPILDDAEHWTMLPWWPPSEHPETAVRLLEVGEKLVEAATTYVATLKELYRAMGFELPTPPPMADGR